MERIEIALIIKTGSAQVVVVPSKLAPQARVYNAISLYPTVYHRTGRFL